ncbi:hypothetical protein GCM10010520_16540 [Rhizobium viscosum]
MIDEAKPDEELIDNAELVVEHPFPDLRRDDDRDRPGNEDGGARQPAARNGFIDEERDCQAENCLDRNRDSREDQRVLDGNPPAAVVDDLKEVVDPRH